MEFLALAILGYAAYAFFKSKGTDGDNGAALQNFDPKVGANILKNSLMYTYDIATNDAEAKGGMARVKLVPVIGPQGRLELPKASNEEAFRAFRWITMMNKGGYAVLGPATMWTETQPWSEKSAQILVVPANDVATIAAMTRKGAPWATIVRAPNKLAPFEKMSSAEVIERLSDKDIA